MSYHEGPPLEERLPSQIQTEIRQLPLHHERSPYKHLEIPAGHGCPTPDDNEQVYLYLGSFYDTLGNKD